LSALPLKCQIHEKRESLRFPFQMSESLVSTIVKTPNAQRLGSPLHVLRDNLATHIVSAIRTHDMRLDHLVTIWTSNRLNGLYRVMGATRAGTSFARFSLWNCHFSYLSLLLV